MTTIMKGKKDNSGRRFKGERGPRPDLNKFKREEAAERLKAWTALSPAEQLAALDRRPGESRKQRARILSRMNKKPVQVAAEHEQNSQETTSDRPQKVKAKDRRKNETKRSGR